jgi:FixJ family two-component response regulator
METQQAHVFFVDDDPGIRSAVQRTLEMSGMTATTFGSAEDCLAAIQGDTCDVVITDIRLGTTDGLWLVHQISYRFPWIPTIVLTAYGDTPLVVNAMKAGALSFLDKPLDAQDLLAAIAKAVEVKKRPATPLKEALSESEARVLRLILDGKTCKEIGDAFHRSIRTIESHRHHIMRKLDVKNIAQLIQRAYELGFNRINPEPPDQASQLDDA